MLVYHAGEITVNGYRLPHCYSDGAERPKNSGAEREVTLGPQESRTISFTAAQDSEGTYSIDINGLETQFRVTPRTGEAYPMRWPFAAIVGGLLVFGFVFYTVFGRRRWV